MEALSIQAVKADYRPAGTQAQSELGDIFQALLRDSVEQREPPVLPPRVEDRPEREAPRRSLADERVGGAGGDRRDRPYRDTEYDARDVPAAVEPRPAPADNPVKEREAAANTETRPRTRESTASDQPSDSRDTSEITTVRDDDTPAPAPAPDGVSEAYAQIAIVSDNRVAVLDPARPTATSQGVAAAGAGTGDQTGQANATAALLGGAGASGKAAGPQAATAAATQAQNPASPQPSAPGTGTATTPATPASAGGNGFSVQVSVTPAQVVATPNAGLGGGATTAAIAAANTPGLTVLATANAKPGTGAAAGASSLDNQSSPGAGRQTGAPQAGTPSNAPIAPTDGQALAAQSASNATAAATTRKQGADSAGSETRTGAALNSPLAKDTPIQSTLAETAPARLAQGGQGQVSGGAARNGTGQNTASRGDGAKPANAQNQQAQSAPQAQTGQAANASAQAGGAPTPTQGWQTSEPGATGGSTGSTDAASGRVASISTIDTGGLTQTTVRGPDTLASLTRSGGTQPTVANQVAVEIQKAVNAGRNQIRVRLNPAELGQIDVSLKVRHDGTVKATVTIDRPETFDLMQRDARGLERALQDAGLKTDSGSLSFNLRGGDQQAPNDGQRGQGLAAQPNPESDCKAESPAPDADIPAPVVSDRALDIRV